MFFIRYEFQTGDYTEDINSEFPIAATAPATVTAVCLPAPCSFYPALLHKTRRKETIHLAY